MGYREYGAGIEGVGIGQSVEEHEGVLDMKCTRLCSANELCYAYTTIENATHIICRLHHWPANNPCVLKVENQFANLYTRLV